MKNIEETHPSLKGKTRRFLSSYERLIRARDKKDDVETLVSYDSKNEEEIKNKYYAIERLSGIGCFIEDIQKHTIDKAVLKEKILFIIQKGDEEGYWDRKYWKHLFLTELELEELVK